MLPKADFASERPRDPYQRRPLYHSDLDEIRRSGATNYIVHLLNSRCFSTCCSGPKPSTLLWPKSSRQRTMAKRGRSEATPIGTLSFSTTFYDVILTGGGNKVLSSILKLLHNRIVLLRRTSISEPNRLPETIAELTDIFDALCARYEAAAGKPSVHHVRQAARTALRALRKTAGYP
ncbi:MAG: FCD domain-containing protein [Proteobacteria bacterium]|nr:FCD domain-containing protein [Pseudomonadota bacterium]